MIRDGRKYVIINDPEGDAMLLHQPSGATEKIGPRPYSGDDLLRAMAKLSGRVNI